MDESDGLFVRHIADVEIISSSEIDIHSQRRDEAGAWKCVECDEPWPCTPMAEEFGD